MLLSLIVAMDRRMAIGKDNALPWRLSDDLRYFKRATLGKPVIMGRKTFESIGKPLSGRDNVVITRNPQWQAAGCIVYADPESALAALAEVPEACVIGGGQIYAATLHRCERLHVTHVDAEVDGDVYFPAIDWGRWRATEVFRHDADERNSHAFRVAVYEPVSAG